MNNQPVELPAALSNLVEPAAVSIYLNRQWQVDWDMVIARRPRILEHEADMPPYFVYPEIGWLLDEALHANTHLMIDTLWHTGARVSELLALTRSSFRLDPENNDCYVSLQTLKTPQRGRPKKETRKAIPKRIVPLTDPAYIESVLRYFETFTPGPKERLFDFTRQTANNRIKRIAKKIPVNAVIQGAPIRVLQGWMGHSNIASTEIYTRVLATETDHFMAAIRYSDAQPPQLEPPQAARIASTQ